VKTFRALVLHEASKEAKKFHGTVKETVCHDLKPPCLPRVKEQQLVREKLLLEGKTD
jgi:hypothetical protein